MGDQGDQGAEVQADPTAAPPIDALIAGHSREIDALLEEPERAQSDYGFNPVHLGAIVGDTKYLTELFEISPEAAGMVVLQDAYGRTPIAYTAILGAIDTCNLLLEVEGGPAGANVQDHQGRTAAHLAASYGRDSVLQALVEHGATVSTQDLSGQTVVHQSVHSPKCLEVTLRGTDAAAAVNQRDTHGFTALHYAASGRHADVIHPLLAVGGVDVDTPDMDGRTALHWACAVGDATMTGLLLAAGASATVSDVGGMTPLMYAARDDFVDCVTALISGDNVEAVAAAQDAEGRTALVQAVSTRAEKATAALLQLPTAATLAAAQGSDGRSTLHCAALAASPDLAVLVWKAGADLDVYDGAGETPLIIAASTGGGVLRALREAGATPTVRAVDATGKTALHHAAIAGCTDEISVLLEWDHQFIPQVDDRGETALHYACFAGNAEIVEMLLATQGTVENFDVPSLINIQDAEGITAMHWASRQGHSEIVATLISHGGYVNFPDHSNLRQTSLDVAVEQGHAETYDVLVAAGAVDAWSLFTHAAIIVQATTRGWLSRRRLARGEDPSVSTFDVNAQSDNMYDAAATELIQGEPEGGVHENWLDGGEFDTEGLSVTDDDLDFQFNDQAVHQPAAVEPTSELSAESATEPIESAAEPEYEFEASTSEVGSETEVESPGDSEIYKEDSTSNSRREEPSKPPKELAPMDDEYTAKVNALMAGRQPPVSTATETILADDTVVVQSDLRQVQTVPLADVVGETGDEDLKHDATGPFTEREVEEELARVQAEREKLEFRLRLREVEQRAEANAARRKEEQRRTESNRIAVGRAQARVRERRRLEKEKKIREVEGAVAEDTTSSPPSDPEPPLNPRGTLIGFGNWVRPESAQSPEDTERRSPVITDFLARHTRQFNEQQRLLQLRYKMDAAIVIQRAYRRYSQGEKLPFLPFLSPSRSPSKSPTRRPSQSSQDGAFPPIRNLTSTQRGKRRDPDPKSRLSRYGGDHIDGTVKPTPKPSRPHTSALAFTATGKTTRKTLYRQMSNGSVKLQPLPKPDPHTQALSTSPYRAPRLNTKRFVSPPRVRPLRSESGLSLRDFRKWETTKGLSKTGSQRLSHTLVPINS